MSSETDLTRKADQFLPKPEGFTPTASPEAEIEKSPLLQLVTEEEVLSRIRVRMYAYFGEQSPGIALDSVEVFRGYVSDNPLMRHFIGCRFQGNSARVDITDVFRGLVGLHRLAWPRGASLEIKIAEAAVQWLCQFFQGCFSDGTVTNDSEHDWRTGKPLTHA